MAEDANLRLDVHRTGRDAPPLARIRVEFARGYTVDGTPVLTRDCSTQTEFQREVKRLVGELTQALEEAGPVLTGTPIEPAEASKPADPRPVSEHRLSSDLRVEQVMTRDVRTIGRNEKIAVADELMRAGRFRHIVVVDADGVLAGIVSQRDIVFSALSWQLGQGSKAHRVALDAVAAKELMQTSAVTIEPEASIEQAARLMNEHKIGCLPVMDGSELVGIITEGDFLSLISSG